jgi:hypothetical protein
MTRGGRRSNRNYQQKSTCDFILVSSRKNHCSCTTVRINKSVPKCYECYSNSNRNTPKTAKANQNMYASFVRADLLPAIKKQESDATIPTLMVSSSKKP